MIHKSFNTGWKLLAAGAVLILALTVVTYLPVMQGGFVFDDEIYLTNNQLVKTSNGLYRFWFTADTPEYRPLTWSLWWQEWRLWDGRATGYHVVNVLLHAVNAVLVWIILRRLNVSGAWLAAAVFAIHPVNVATGAWISEQKNTLSMLFYALSILLYLRFDEEEDHRQGCLCHRGISCWWWYGLSLAAGFLALLSKTAIVMLPVVLLGCLWWRHGRVRTRDWLGSAPYFMASLAMAVVTIVQHRRALGETVVQTGGFAGRLAAAGWAPWFYLSKALLPINLTVIYPKWGIDPERLVSYVPGVLWVGLFLVFWWKRETWGRPLFFGLGYFVVMLFPVLGFFDQGFYQFSLVADHWQYYSIVGVIALAVAAGQKIGSRMGKWGKHVNLLTSVAVLVVLGVASWRRNSVYVSEETLWRDNIAKIPDSWVAHNNLGCALDKMGRFGDAISQFEQTLRLNPSFALAHNNLGDTLRRSGRPQEAIKHLEQALRLKPDYAEAHLYLGLALSDLGKIQDAIRHYEEALRLKPDYADANNNLGVALQRAGRVPEAIGHYEQALRLKPDSAEAHNNLAVALQRAGRVAEAIGHYEQALRLKPDSAEAHNNLAVALQQVGKLPEAIGHYEQALRLNPDYAEVHSKLGGALLQTGRLKDAVEHYEQALRIAPNLAEAQNNLAWLLATLPPGEGGNPVRAVTLAERVCKLGGDGDASQLDTLAVAYASAGRFNDAIATSEKALALARKAGQTGLVKEIEARLQLYRDGRPYRSSVSS